MDTFVNEKKTFDINTYETEDLLGILDLTGQAPINENKIDEKIKTLKYKLRNNKKKIQIFKFLENAAIKLKKQFKKFNEQTWELAYEHDDSEASEVFKNQYQNKNDPTKNLIVNEQSNIIGRVKQTLQDKMAIQGTVQGDKNPIQRKTIKRIVNFDSHYREILDPSGSTCATDTESRYFSEANPQVRLYTSTNYTVNLNQPLLNVVDITVDNVEIPYSWHVFSEDYGTHRFFIEVENGYSGNIFIKQGNYSSGGALIAAINAALGTVPPAALNGAGQPFFAVNFVHEEESNQVIIQLVNDQKVTFKWYIEDAEGSQCTAPFREGPNSLLEPPKPGNKINYNLGWLLGFRTQTLELDPLVNYNVQNSYTNNFEPGKYRSSSTIDVFGPKYLLLTLDDFNNNKPNKDLISLIDNNANNFKLPEYYKPQTMNTTTSVLGTDQTTLYQPGHKDEAGYECVDVAGPPSDRGCAENDINIDLISNLTKKQKFSIAQMIQANTASNRKPRYSSPNSTDILLRIPINSPPNNPNQIISMKNENPEETKRVYFGPVKLRKFNVRLLNDKGFELNLKDRDWSFSLIINQLYQF
tara:strand:+ start:1336 stop:3084 length:1749 start_codon:yes stop_codon:yes gene_type:complete